MFDPVTWTDEADRYEDRGRRVEATAISPAEVWSRDEDDRFASDLPAVMMLALLLFSPFLYDALSALTHIH